MSEISGKINTIIADETNLVSKGQILIQLEDTDAKLALKNAEDNLALTVRNINQHFKNVEAARANVKVKESDVEKAEEDYNRRKNLSVNNIISEEDLRHFKLTLESAQDSLELAKKQFDSAKAIVQNSDLFHHPEVKRAQDNLRMAYLNLRRTVIYSPVTGYVAKRPAQVGQQITADTVLMVVAPLNEIWVDANFKETQLENLRIGQSVDIKTDMYGSDAIYKGSIIGISPGTGNAFDLLPPQNATGNWIKILQRVPVRIKIENIQDLEKFPLRIGLSATVTVKTQNREGERLSQLPQTNISYQTKDFSVDLKEADSIINDIIQANAP